MVFKLQIPKTKTKIIGTAPPNFHGSGFTKKTTHAQETTINKEQKFVDQTDADAALTAAAETALHDATVKQAHVLSVKTSDDELDYDEWQNAAIEGAVWAHSFCLIGAAGTGKTTVMRKIIKRIESSIREISLNTTGLTKSENAKAYAIAFCAFTGRAVQQMKRALPSEYHNTCATIHKLLGYAPVMEEYFNEENQRHEERKMFRPSFTAQNKLPYDIIVIDESSMLPIRLWHELYAASKKDCRFIMIGDLNQLPPVQDRSIFPFAMLKWPKFELKTIHRQALDNPIIANAHRILKGEFPLKDNKHFAILDLPGGSIGASTHILGAIQHLHKKGKFDPLVDALIVPQNTSVLGQVHLNEYLSQYFNPPKKDPTSGVILNRRIAVKASRGHTMLAIGDKVMLLQNDSDLGLTNGQIGIVTDMTANGKFRGGDAANTSTMAMHDTQATFNQADFLDDIMNDKDEAEPTKDDKQDAKDENQRQASHITTIRFGDVDANVETRLSSVGDYNKIAHAYAFTCHKSQGGEYPIVVIAMHSANAVMLCREWLYTAVTRAREQVVLMCNDRALLTALKSQRIKGQTLDEKAQSFINLMDSGQIVEPLLPEPRVLN